MISALMSAFPTPRGISSIKTTEPVIVNDSVEQLKAMTQKLSSRDVVIEETIPTLQELAAKIIAASHKSPRIPGCISILALRGEAPDVIDSMYKSIADHCAEKSPVLSINVTSSVDTALNLCKSKNFDVVICEKVFDNHTAAAVIAKFLGSGINLPFIVITDQDDSPATETYATTMIDKETATCAKAVEIACKQSVIRHKEKTKMQEYAGEMLRAFGSMERLKCQIET